MNKRNCRQQCLFEVARPPRPTAHQIPTSTKHRELPATQEDEHRAKPTDITSSEGG